jgi:hypothetical protein
LMIDCAPIWRNRHSPTVMPRAALPALAPIATASAAPTIPLFMVVY